jgi:hypothetical protein
MKFVLTFLMMTVSNLASATEPVKPRRSYPASAISILTAVADGHPFLGIFYRDPKSSKSPLSLIAETNSSVERLQGQIKVAVSKGQWVTLAADGDEFEFVPPPVEDSEIESLKAEIRKLKSDLADCRGEKQRLVEERPVEVDVSPTPSTPTEEPKKEYDPDEIRPGMPKPRR